MNLLRLWWLGVTRPARAFDELRSRPAPAWGFWVVLAFNLLISATTLLALYLLDVRPFLESWLTFLPTEDYLLAEIFFLPPLRVLVWLLGAAVVHLGLRLAKHPGGMDTLLNVGGLEYLVTMPFILLSDWLLIILDAYWIAEYTHPLAAVWGLVLTVIGLKRMLGVRTGLAILLTLVSMLLTIPFLAIFAR
jgi:hypothetical protein